MLIPDLLGYGGTDKPTSPAAYKVKEMATEVMDILEHEKLDKVHAVGHDFGSHILSRIIDYFPHRLLSSTFIAIPYIAPGQHFDLEMVKQITEKAIGFEKYGYMRFLSRENSPEILEAHVSQATVRAWHWRLHYKAAVRLRTFNTHTHTHCTYNFITAPASTFNY